MKRKYFMALLVTVLVGLDTLYSSSVVFAKTNLIPQVLEYMNHTKEKSHGDKISQLIEEEKYKEVLTYINESLKTEQSADLYNEKGYILANLDRKEEAIKAFMKALEIDPNFDSALNNLFWVYGELGDYEKALYYIEKALLVNSNNAVEYQNKGAALIELNRYEEALQAYEEAIKLDPEDYFSYYGQGIVYSILNQYDFALESFMTSAELEGSMNPYIYNHIIDCYVYLDDFKEADEYIEKVLQNKELNDDIYDLIAGTYNYLGNIFVEKEEYTKAVEYYNKALKLGDNYEVIYVNKAYSLLYNKQYEECIELSEEILAKYPNNTDVYWLIGDSYSRLHESEKSIESYKTALKLHPKETQLLIRLAFEYYYVQEYDKAKKVISQIQGEDALSDYVVEFKKSLERLDQPLDDQVIQFVKDNYLYIDKVKDYDEKVNSFKKKKVVNSKDVNQFIESIRRPDDLFTFVLTGENYKDYTKMQKETSIDYKQLDEQLHYMRISSFNLNTYQEFCEIINQIEDTTQAKLIIDLRSNGGGDATAANDMLDLLLPDCVTSTLIDHKGYITEQYYSSPSQVEFKKIYIFVDEYSASSSELLTLGLKKYLNNVTIIGKPTFGKGVVQTVFENKEDEWAIFLVNSYWNVKEENILKKKIQPDIYVESENIEAYMDEIK